MPLARGLNEVKQNVGHDVFSELTYLSPSHARSALDDARGEGTNSVRLFTVHPGKGKH